MLITLISYPSASSRIQAAFSDYPAVKLVGPRHCEKTTSSKFFTRTDSDVVDLEFDDDVNRRKSRCHRRRESARGWQTARVPATSHNGTLRATGQCPELARKFGRGESLLRICNPVPVRAGANKVHLVVYN